MRLGTGRLTAYDPRDADYPVTLSESFHKTSAATEVFYRTHAVLDQGNSPECVGYACRHFLNAWPLENQHWDEPAHEIYVLARTLDEFSGEDYEGTSLRGGLKALQKLGHIQSYVWARNVEQAKRWLLAHNGTVLVGSMWFDEMFNATAEPAGPPITVPHRSTEDGHAWLLTGYSTLRHEFRGMSSWGDGWGYNGRFWLKEDDLQFLIDSDGELAMPVEQLVKPHATIQA